MNYRDSIWSTALTGIGAAFALRWTNSIDAAIMYGAAMLIIQICTLLVLRKVDSIVEALKEH